MNNRGDIKSILANMTVFAIFVLALFAFIITTQQDNSVTIPITNDSRISETYQDLNSSFVTYKSSSQSSLDSFSNVTPTESYGDVNVNAVISPVRVGRTIILGFWNIFVKLPISVLGISPAVAGILSALIVILVIIGIWAVYKGVIS